MRHLMLIGAALLLSACSASPSPVVRATAIPVATPQPLPTSTPRTAARPGVGDVGWIYATRTAGGSADSVPVAGNADDFFAYLKASRAKDDVGMQQLFRDNRLISISTGTQARVIDSIDAPYDIVQVRFIDGEWPTTTGWLDHLWMVAQLPDGFIHPTQTPR